jgi:integrase/recombinase XerD
MATTLKLILDERRANEDGTFTIVIRLTHRRNSRYVATDCYSNKANWNEDGEYLRANQNDDKAEVRRINEKIQKKKAELTSIINRLDKFNELEELSIQELRDKLIKKPIKETFRSYTTKIINELKRKGKFGNAQVYEQAINFIERNTNGRDYELERVNLSLLKHLEIEHIAKGYSFNSLSFYLRTIRAIINRAIREKLLSRDKYPFEYYTIRETKTKKRALRKGDIEKIRDIALIPETTLWHSRNYFMFSFYNIGMNFVDIAHLKMKNIIDGRIVYTRAKTGKEYSIFIMQPTAAILEHYINNKEADDYVFPIIKQNSLELQRIDVQNGLRNLNHSLRDIAKMCGIEAKVTSYVARHSWASIANRLDVPIRIISGGMGHEDIKTTQIYLDDVDNEEVDIANQLILS